MSAHQTKSSIKADSCLQDTDTFSSRHVHLLCTHNAPGLGYTDNPATNTLHLPPFLNERNRYNEKNKLDKSDITVDCNK